jgi:hypothetical protein
VAGSVTRSPLLLVFGVQQRSHLVDVDTQVLAVGAPTRSTAPPQERTGGGLPASTQGPQTVAQNTPTGVR